MRYSSDHKALARKKLLDTAGALAKEKGFGTTGVDALTAAAGMTSGAFYSHFKSKPELLNAIVENELQRTIDLFAGKDVIGLLKAMKFYLSETHVNHPELGCPLPSLSAEVARADEATKLSFETLLIQLKDQIQSQLNSSNDAWTAIAQAVGAVLIARAMATQESQKELLDASKGEIEAILNRGKKI